MNKGQRAFMPLTDIWICIDDWALLEDKIGFTSLTPYDSTTRYIRISTLYRLKDKML